MEYLKAIYIQKIYRSLKIRRKFKILQKLPIELQEKIINYNKSLYQQHRFNHKLSDVLIQKIEFFINKYYNSNYWIKLVHGAISYFTIDQNLQFFNQDEILKSNNKLSRPLSSNLINYIFFLFYLLSKYQPILIKKSRLYSFDYINSNNQPTNIYLKLVELSELLLKYRTYIKNLINYKHISDVFNFKLLYLRNN